MENLDDGPVDCVVAALDSSAAGDCSVGASWRLFFEVAFPMMLLASFRIAAGSCCSRVLQLC